MSPRPIHCVFCKIRLPERERFDGEKTPFRICPILRQHLREEASRQGSSRKVSEYQTTTNGVGIPVALDSSDAREFGCTVVLPILSASQRAKRFGECKCNPRSRQMTGPYPAGTGMKSENFSRGGILSPGVPGTHHLLRQQLKRDPWGRRPCVSIPGTRRPDTKRKRRNCSPRSESKHGMGAERTSTGSAGDLPVGRRSRQKEVRMIARDILGAGAERSLRIFKTFKESSAGRGASSPSNTPVPPCGRGSTITTCDGPTNPSTTSHPPQYHEGQCKLAAWTRSKVVQLTGEHYNSLEGCLRSYVLKRKKADLDAT